MSRRKKGEHAARIQRAVVGIIIPIMAINDVYQHAEKLIGDGADDAALAAGIRKFLGVSHG
jgi:hypothetical protein